MIRGKSGIACFYPNGVSPCSPGLVAIGDLPAGGFIAQRGVFYLNGVASVAAPSGRNPVGVEIGFTFSNPG